MAKPLPLSAAAKDIALMTRFSQRRFVLVKLEGASVTSRKNPESVSPLSTKKRVDSVMMWALWFSAGTDRALLISPGEGKNGSQWWMIKKALVTKISFQIP